MSDQERFAAGGDAHAASYRAGWEAGAGAQSGEGASGPALHRVSLSIPGVSGMGTLALLDDAAVNGLTGVDVRIGMHEPTTVTFRLMVASLDITAAAATVWYEVAVVDADGREHYASAPSIPEALRELAEDLEGEPHEHGIVR